MCKENEMRKFGCEARTQFLCFIYPNAFITQWCGKVTFFSHILAPTIAEAKRFETTMALVDMVVSATVESWFWTLPSNRFTDCLDLPYSQKKKALDLLNEMKTGIQNQEDTTESILGILNSRLDQEHTSFARYFYKKNPEKKSNTCAICGQVAKLR